MRKFYRSRRLLSVVALLFSGSLVGFYLNSGRDKAVEKFVFNFPVDTAVVVNLSFVGDLMCHSDQFQYAQLGPDSFNFKGCFERVKPWLEKADWLAGNLETTLSGASARYSGYPQFNTPDEYLDAVVDAGFDFLVTSNNHSLDRGESGVIRTIQMLDKAKMPHTGTYLSQQDRDSIRIVDVKGIKLAILNYTYGTNGLPLPAGKPWTLNLIDTALIRTDLIRARNSTADLVLVFVHYGNEYERLPGAYQKMVVNHCINNGADIIIGAHPHVVQPVDYFKTKGGRLDTGFVAYSLGNFISHQYNRYTDTGVLLNLEVTKDLRSSKISITDASFLSTWVYRGVNIGKKLHVIFPSGDTQDLPPWLTADLLAKKNQAYSDTKSHIVTYTKKIKEISPVKILPEPVENPATH